MKKKILSLMLTMSMVVSLLPTAIFAAGSSYDITNGTPESAKETNNGYITIDKTTAEEGETVTVMVNPAEGYQLKSLEATTISTIADVLATVEGFPEGLGTATTTHPDNAWVCGDNRFAFTVYNGAIGALILNSNVEEPDAFIIGLTVEVAKGDNCYTADRGNYILTFNMENGTLASIVFSSANEKWQRRFGGTYEPTSTPSPAPPPDVTLVKQDDGTYIFTMPSTNVEVTADFEKIPGVPIGNLIATVAGGFPTTAENGWVNENGAKSYSDGQDIIFARGSSITVPLSFKAEKSGNNYVYQSAGYRLTFVMADNVLEKVILSDVEAWFSAANGTYAPAHTHDDITFTAWNDADKLPDTEGYYYLNTDVTLNETWQVPAGTTNLCLNGHVIKQTASTSVIKVGTGATLNLYDCGTDGTITGGNTGCGGGVYVEGTFNMYGGVITGNESSSDGGGGVYIDYFGSFTMIDGTIAANTATTMYGGGVYVDGSFTMNGGSIGHNSAICGGGVCVFSGNFTMTGGSIDHNSASSGGGVYNLSQMTVTGTSEITDNSAKSLGAGVCVYNNDKSTITLGGSANIIGNMKESGGSKTANDVYLPNGKYFTLDTPENDMQIGVTTATAPVDGTPVKITTNGASTDTEYFTSDNTDYEVLFNSDHLELAVKSVPLQYTVAFDMGGHGTQIPSQTVKEGNKATEPATPSENGYSFDGWYTDSEFNSEFNFDSAITKDISLYAKWSCLHENTEVRDAKDATCAEDGYTGDTYCLDCEKIIEEGKAIPAIEHTWENDFTVDKEPTYEEEGSKSIHCTKCEATKDVTAIPTLEPTITPSPEPSGDPTPSPKPSGEPTPTTDPEPSGDPAPTNEPTPTQAPELNVGDFVDHCYEVALGREADEDGYNYWKNQLTNGEACGAQVGFGFIFSSEYINKNTTNEQFVTDMYSMFFGREADEAGYNYWLEQLNNGTATREDVFAGFANSEEFFNLCSKYGVVSGAYLAGVPNDQQGGVNCFVVRLYKVCLNRLPDMGGQAGWVMQLMNGEVSGSSCAYGFVFSPEFVNMNLDNTDFVKYMYSAFFGREADEAGLNYWVEQLNAGTATRENVFAGFTGSAEFADLCASYGINV